MIINTEVQTATVEIEDTEYTIAPRTIETMEKLIDIENTNQRQPKWVLWRLELEVLLGKTACRKLFHDGKKENLDRMERIYNDVSEEFNRASNAITTETQEQAAQVISDALAPVNELLKRLSDYENGGRKQIHK